MTPKKRLTLGCRGKQIVGLSSLGVGKGHQAVVLLAAFSGGGTRLGQPLAVASACQTRVLLIHASMDHIRRSFLRRFGPNQSCLRRVLSPGTATLFIQFRKQTKQTKQKETNGPRAVPNSDKHPAGEQKGIQKHTTSLQGGLTNKPKF